MADVSLTANSPLVLGLNPSNNDELNISLDGSSLISGNATNPYISYGTTDPTPSQVSSLIYIKIPPNSQS